MKNSAYGFHGRLNADFPSQLIVDSTEICNLACIHCPHPQFKSSALYGARSLDPELNKKLVNEVRESGHGITQYIRYTGEGEPLIHPRIFEMMKYAVDHSGVPVSLTTNGTILNEERVERLLACGVDVVDISIDAFTPQTYETIRVRGDLEVTRRNVMTLLRLREEAPKRTQVVVSYVEQPQNQHETEDFEEFWKNQGCDFVVIRRLHSGAGALVQIADRMQSRYPKEPRRPCLYPWERLLLSPEGHLRFCPEDWVKGSDFTDFRSITIKEAWQSEFMQDLRQAHLDNSFENHAFCGQCPDWKQTRWPGEGRSYADMMEEFTEAGPATPPGSRGRRLRPGS